MTHPQIPRHSTTYVRSPSVYKTRLSMMQTATNFGLKNRSYPALTGCGKDSTQWQKFEKQVSHLNAEAPSNTQYRVLFMGRHGEGYHNAAES